MEGWTVIYNKSYAMYVLRDETGAVRDASRYAEYFLAQGYQLSPQTND